MHAHNIHEIITIYFKIYYNAYKFLFQISKLSHIFPNNTKVNIRRDLLKSNFD